MELRKITFAMAALFTLSACGGGGGGSSSSSEGSASQESSSTKEMNGIYFGSGYENGFGSFDVVALVDNGRMYAASTTDVGYMGSLTPEGDNKFTSSLTLYDYDNYSFDSASVSGSYANKTSISGGYSRKSGPTGDIELEYLEELYEYPSSLESISGIWTVTNVTNSTTVTFNAKGDITGQDSAGCVFSGSLSTPDTSVNMYRLTLKIESCGDGNGTYQGLAAVLPGETYPSMIAFAGNSKMGYAFELVQY